MPRCGCGEWFSDGSGLRDHREQAHPGGLLGRADELVKREWNGLDRAQGRGFEIGGMVWAFVFFIGLIILGGAFEILVMDSAVDPMIAFAGSMDQSTQSQTGLNWFEQWRNAFTLIVLSIAGAFLIARAALYSGRRY